MHTQTVDQILEHHGILGMRWGVRRPRGKDGLVKQSAAGKPTKEYLRAQALRQKGAQRLSTKELQEVNKRLEMEKKFKELNPSQLKRAMDTVKTATKYYKTMDEVVKTLTGESIGSRVMNMIEKKTGK